MTSSKAGVDRGASELSGVDRRSGSHILFDSHLHLTADGLAQELSAVLERAHAAGVLEMVTVASDAADAARAVELAAARTDVWSTVGLHPHEASTGTPEALAEIERLAGQPRVVAIGETGLDYHYGHATRPAQRRSFVRQMELGERLGLPVVVHVREADADAAAVIHEFSGRVLGVLHCFTGGDALLEAGLSAGWYVSFSGIVTFRGYDGVERVRRIPADRLLIETDSPYLAPVPRRGKQNEPAFLVHTCEAVAAFRGVSGPEIARLTRSNARKLYGLGSGEAAARGVGP